MPVYERFCFLAEWRTGTYRNAFPHDAPLASSIFGRVKELHGKGRLAPYRFADKSISLSDIEVGDDGFATLLIRLMDPSILDNDYLNRQNGQQRRAERLQVEDPVVSAHVVVNCNEEYDFFRQYPTAIENVDFLTKTSIQRYLNMILSQYFRERRQVAGGGEKIYQPKIELQSPQSHTIAGSFHAGGILKEIKWVEDRVAGGAFADDAYPVHERHDVSISYGNSPTGDAAVNLLRSAWRHISRDRPKKVSVIIEEDHDRIKTVRVDQMRDDILTNFFITQELIGPLRNPFVRCEAAIRPDVAEAMRTFCRYDPA